METATVAQRRWYRIFRIACDSIYRIEVDWSNQMELVVGTRSVVVTNSDCCIDYHFCIYIFKNKVGGFEK